MAPHSKTCQVEEYGAHIVSNDNRLFNSVFLCYRKAKHSMVIRENKIGGHRKFVFRLCDEHFKQIQENSHPHIGCDCSEGHAGYLFRENRL